MKVGGASVGYTSGSLYRRHQSVGYTPGSHYKRFGNLGMPQSRNMSRMNRDAAETVSAAFQNAGPQIFEAKTAESYGLSELAAQQVLKRVKEMAMAIAAGGENLSAANGGIGSALDETA